ncbi:MAG: hypothetical protein WBE58_03445 [Verrucomicrobiales bacterium]
MTRPPVTVYLLAILVSLLAGCGKPAATPEAPPSLPSPPLIPGTSAMVKEGAQDEPNDPRSQVMGKELHRLAVQQANGLGQGTVKVNGAWNYIGYSFLSPDPAATIPARLVAVDITVQGHTPAFDLDDIEIVDGGNQISYGSDPHVTFLTPEGTVLPDNQPVPVAPATTRVLLIYGFPKATPDFDLYYWGHRLTGHAVKVGESGWGLPYPPEPKAVP